MRIAQPRAFGITLSAQATRVSVLQCSHPYKFIAFITQMPLEDGNERTSETAPAEVGTSNTAGTTTRFTFTDTDNDAERTGLSNPEVELSEVEVETAENGPTGN